MREEERSGPVTSIDLTPGEAKFEAMVHKIMERKGKEELKYEDIFESDEWKEWVIKKTSTRAMVARMKGKGVLVGPKGIIRPVVSKKKKEIPLGARKYLSAIDQRIRELKSKKQKIEEDAKKQIIEADSAIIHWQDIKQKIAQQPEFAELFEELKKLE